MNQMVRGKLPLQGSAAHVWLQERGQAEARAVNLYLAQVSTIGLRKYPDHNTLDRVFFVTAAPLEILSVSW